MVERVRITVSSGRVSVVGETRDDIEVDGAPFPAQNGELELRGRADPYSVRVPAGTDVVVGSASGNVELSGPLGAVSVTTTSGDVRAEAVESIDARTVSGKLRVARSGGSVRLTTKSANVRVGRADGEIRISTISGTIEIQAANAGVSVTTVSGRIGVHVAGREPVRVETVSGKVDITVPEGIRPNVRHRTMSGKRRVEPDEGDDLVIKARSVSGNITVGIA